MGLTRSEIPGRQGMAGDRQFGCRNDQGGLLRENWGVRVGSVGYPDYIFGTGGFTGGYLLSPDEADALAEHLHRCAAWARAQQIVGGHGYADERQ